MRIGRGRVPGVLARARESGKSFSDLRCEFSDGQVVALFPRPDGAIFSTGGVAESLDV